MIDLIAGFERFVLRGAQAYVMRSRFSRVLEATALAKDATVEQLISRYLKVSGLYFWVMRHGGAEYKIYVGQTNSLSYRVSNYVAAFQAHSPNDYKLQIFYAFMSELLPSAQLDLYFAPVVIETLDVEEKCAISEYGPLLNKLPRPTKEDRAELQRAFVTYYRSAFEQRLRK
jgi:hypothetical protein